MGIKDAEERTGLWLLAWKSHGGTAACHEFIQLDAWTNGTLTRARSFNGPGRLGHASLGDYDYTRLTAR